MDDDILPTLPTQLSHCINNDGTINMSKVLMLRRRQQEEEDEDDDALLLLASNTDNGNGLVKNKLASLKQRTCFQKNLNLCRCEDGSLKTIGPRQSNWYVMYIKSPALDDPKFNKKFRRRFRCSYDSFQKLMLLVLADNIFNRWLRTDAVGREPSPIHLLVLGVLRYIGRGWTFDDLEENTSISEETHRQFLHVFILWGSTSLYDMFVTFPTEPGVLLDFHTKEMEACGLHGCVA